MSTEAKVGELKEPLCQENVVCLDVSMDNI